MRIQLFKRGFTWGMCRLVFFVAIGGACMSDRLWPNLQLITSAYAYKVKRVCEEVTTKAGTSEKCRTVLDQSPPEEKKDDKKGDDKKGDAKKGDDKKGDAKKAPAAGGH